MTRHLILASLLMVVCPALLGELLPAESTFNAPPGIYRPGAVLVRFRDGVTGPTQARLLAGQGGQPERTLAALNLVSLAVAPGREPETVAALRRLPEVAFAELDYRGQAAEIPNDPAWNQQWSLAQIGLPAAWEVTTGTPGIVIAMVDSGATLGHPDLAGQLWINAGEVSGNGIDDDGNGKVDDVHGWHFYQNWTGSAFVPAENADVADDFGHGTHVAGIAAAAANNGIGIAGIAWGATVLPVKALDQYGMGWYSDIAAGIVYAADNGARIINLSLGGASVSATLCEAVAHAVRQGAVVIASAGNDKKAVFYPAACDGALAVTATDRADQRADFSNFGPQIALAAPGVDIYSTWPWRDGYFTESGTSSAAPHVSGVAALVWSRWPEWSNLAVSRRLTETAVDVSSPGWDPYTGWGRLDAAAAVGAIISPTTMTPTPTPTATDLATSTPSPTATCTPLATSTPTELPSATATATPTETPTMTATAAPTSIVTPTPTATFTPPPRRYLPLVMHGWSTRHGP